MAKPWHSSRWGWYYADQGFRKLNITLLTSKSEKKSRVCGKALEQSYKVYFFSRIGVLRLHTHPPPLSTAALSHLYSSSPSIVLSCSPQVTVPGIGWESKRTSGRQRWHSEGHTLETLAGSSSACSPPHPTPPPYNRPWRQKQAQAHHQVQWQQPSTDSPPATLQAWL